MEMFKTEYKKINSKLISKADYQREIRPNRVKLIVKNYNPNLVNPAKVSYRDGKYWVFDGQHTIAALKEMNGGQDILVDCKVFYGMKYEDEALLFAEQFGICTPVPNEEKLRSRYLAGDVQVIEFKETVESCGITCDFNKRDGSNRLACYKAAYDIFAKKGGAEQLTKVLSIDKAAWGGMRDSFRREIVCGLDVLIRENANVFDEKRAIHSLSKVTPLVIVRDGKAMAKGGTRRFAFQMAQVYNKGLRTLPPLSVVI